MGRGGNPQGTRLLELEALGGFDRLSRLSGVEDASSVLGWRIAVAECSASKYLCTRLRPASPGTLEKTFVSTAQPTDENPPYVF